MYFISLFSLSKLFSMHKIVRFSPFSVFNQRKNDGEDMSVRIASFYSVSYKEPNTLRVSVVCTYIHTPEIHARIPNARPTFCPSPLL